MVGRIRVPVARSKTPYGHLADCFALIFVLLYMLFQSVTESIVLILPTLYAMTGGLLLQYMMGFNFSVAVWVGYIALFGIAVETGVVMVTGE